MKEEKDAAAAVEQGTMSEREIDENLKESFPASDPPSWTLGTDHRDEESGKERGDDSPGE